MFCFERRFIEIRTIFALLTKFSRKMECSVNDWEEICRICMEKGRLLPIFGAPLNSGKIRKIANDHSELIKKHADIKLLKDDGLPQKMCYGCLYLVKSAEQFKETCEKSDRLLNSAIKREAAEFTPSNGDSTHNRSILKIDIRRDNRKNNSEENKNQMIPSNEFIIPRENIKHQECSSSDDDDYAYSSDGFLENEHFEDTVDPESEIVGPTSKKHPQSRELSIVKLLVSNRRVRKKQKDIDKAFELRAITRKATNQAAKHKLANSSDLHQMVVTGRKLRHRVFDQHFQTKIRSTFRAVQGGDAKFLQCTVCDIIVKAPSAHNHAQKHIGYKIICEVCGKGFVSNFGLEQHQMTRHGKEKSLACQYCNYKTGTRFELGVHERSHTGERPFVCDMCGKSFHRRRCMVNHVGLHAKDRPHKCQNCPKSFVNLSDLRVHVNSSHDRRYVYKCDVCGLSYAKVGSVRKHLTTQHSILREQQGKISRVYVI